MLNANPWPEESENRIIPNLSRIKETLPKAQRTRRLSSAYQSNLFRSYHKFFHKSWSNFTDWWFFVTYGGLQLTGSDDFSSPTGGSKWLEVMTFHHLRGVPSDWKWWFYGTHRGSQLTGSDDFSSLTGGFNWMEVMIICHSRGVSTDLLVLVCSLEYHILPDPNARLKSSQCSGTSEN